MRGILAAIARLATLAVLAAHGAFALLPVRAALALLAAHAVLAAFALLAVLAAFVMLAVRGVLPVLSRACSACGRLRCLRAPGTLPVRHKHRVRAGTARTHILKMRHANRKWYPMRRQQAPLVEVALCSEMSSGQGQG